jgi:hypothetical protein
MDRSTIGFTSDLAIDRRRSDGGGLSVLRIALARKRRLSRESVHGMRDATMRCLWMLPFDGCPKKLRCRPAHILAQGPGSSGAVLPAIKRESFVLSSNKAAGVGDCLLLDEISEKGAFAVSLRLRKTSSHLISALIRRCVSTQLS